MEKLSPKAVIFDLGCTLIEYESLPWDELGQLAMANVHTALVKNGYRVPEVDEFRALFTEVKGEYRQLAAEKLVEWSIPQAVDRLLGKLKIDSEAELIDTLFEAYYRPVDERLFVYDDVLETLERVRGRGLTTGLISNTIFPAEAHLRELKRFGIKPFLDFTIFSSTFGYRKPHPDIFYKGANLAGFAPSECVYIGDRYIEDVKGPGGIGMHAILKVIPGRVYPEEMPDSIRKIEKLSDLADHLVL